MRRTSRARLSASASLLLVFCAAFPPTCLFNVDARSASDVQTRGTAPLALGPPFLTQRAKLAPADGGRNLFGQSVAVGGDVAVVGAPGDNAGAGDGQGSAYVFIRDGSAWTRRQKLTAPDGGELHFFGFSVALGGDTIVVGAPGFDTPGRVNIGAVYVFVRSGAVWSLQQKLMAGDASDDDDFGTSVAVEGDTIVVGAAKDNTSAGINAGSAYVFTRSGTVWTERQKFVAPANEGGAFDNFGTSVGISGDTIAVGSPNNFHAAGATPGAVFVFTRSGSTWTQQQKLVATDPAANLGMGSSLSIDGDTIAAGTNHSLIGTGDDNGEVFVFTRSGSAWTQQQKLTAADAQPFDFFGISVALEGDRLVVGSYSRDTPAGFNAGAAYFFTRTGGVWTERQKFEPRDAGADSLFGSAVALDGGTVLVGARNARTIEEEFAITVSPGAAYVFTPEAADSTVIEFGAATFTAGEQAGQAQVTLTRAGDLSGASAVRCETFDVTASERSDYLLFADTVRFAPGEQSKTVTVFVTNDSFRENVETLALVLSHPEGAILGPRDTATLFVESDDAASGPAPINDAGFFVRQHYRDFLGRDPDDAGLAFWTSQITECGADAGCVDFRRTSVSAAFFLSIEFQETGFFAYLTHRAAYNAGERLPLRNFTRDREELRRGLVVGEPGWEQRLEANKQAYTAAFVERQEFLALYPHSMTAAEFVETLSSHPGGSLSAAERADLTARLAAGTLSRAQVLRAIAEDADFRRREKNPAFVYMQYAGYLRRNPNERPFPDTAGYQFWLNKLNEFNGDFKAAEMVRSFLVSSEYRLRFGL